MGDVIPEATNIEALPNGIYKATINGREWYVPEGHRFMESINKALSEGE